MFCAVNCNFDLILFMYRYLNVNAFTIIRKENIFILRKKLLVFTIKVNLYYILKYLNFLKHFCDVVLTQHVSLYYVKIFKPFIYVIENCWSNQ